ncbi:hypothetical protein CDAR_43051 [Caerostris darwini]|uniref:Uncharacterized protein n=1 Tax=Caerostris darwini TaxID=1538125 RepID=A0AAV4WKD0_9ARAC|nr:hypothetical protein CDAR_43051 [Caerostris darwini]
MLRRAGGRSVPHEYSHPPTDKEAINAQREKEATAAVAASWFLYPQRRKGGVQKPFPTHPLETVQRKALVFTNPCDMVIRRLISFFQVSLVNDLPSVLLEEETSSTPTLLLTPLFT